MYSLFRESVFVCFDLALGLFGVGGGGGGGGIWDMHTLHFILSDIVVNCRMCVCVYVLVQTVYFTNVSVCFWHAQ